MKSGITGVIITLNEEKNIVECIQSLAQVCSEIIVVDSGSTDKTLQLAKKQKARVYTQAYLGDGPQKNFGLQFAKNDWILSLDADERLTEEAVKKIQSLDLSTSEFEAFTFRRRNYIGSRWIKVCGWYPDESIRLYNRTKTRFSESKGHAAVTTENYSGLEVDILHYSYKNVSELFAKATRFSARGAKMLYAKGKKTSPLSPFVHGLASFFRKYFLQKGILGGVDGFTVSLSAAVNAYLKYAKLRELQKDPEVLAKEDMNSIW